MLYIVKEKTKLYTKKKHFCSIFITVLSVKFEKLLKNILHYSTNRIIWIANNKKNFCNFFINTFKY